MRQIPRRLTFRRAAILLGVLVVLAVGAAYAALTVMTSDAPPPAALQAAPESDDVVDAGPISGDWVIAGRKQDFVGYRVREKLGFLPAPDDAVGRTNAVSGSARFSGSKLVSAHIIAFVNQLQSDQPPRDGVLRQDGLQTDTYPKATLDLSQPVDLGHITRGAVLHGRADSKVTLHGVTRRLTIPFAARWNGSTLQMAGGTTIELRDFKLEMASRLEMRIASTGRLEFELTFKRGRPGAAPAQPAPVIAQNMPSEPNADRKQIARERVSKSGSGLLVSARRRRPDLAVDLYTLRASGSDLRRLTDDPRSAQAAYDSEQPQVTSGGEIVFSRQRTFMTKEPTPAHVYVLRGGRPTQLTRGPLDDVTPALSADGTQIAFARRVAGGDQRFAIWVAGSDGTDAHRVTDPGSGSDESPTWSPDGRSLAFTCFTSTDDICTVQLDGGRRTRLTQGDTYDSNPSYSPNGRNLAFSREGGIAVMDVATKKLVRLTRGRRTRDAVPQWSPTGSEIAFIRSDVPDPDATFTGPGRAMIIDVASRRVTRVPAPLGDVLSVTWQR